MEGEIMKNRRLIELREKANLTQKQLAEIIGISQSMIARIERGDREPRKHIKMQLAKFFGVTVEWLFYEQVEYLESYNTLTPTGTDGE
ncbi:helix-turn-helix transcriptional regulator [Moorella sp. ACPs]|uniref:helix-turn-helix transcriptional regulator n=1 Tax=Neomoorella carbonis TaxID=3062783 RepID=UPI003245E125